MITLENVVGILSLVLLMACLIVGVVLYFRKARKAVLALGFMFRVRCENCGMEYDVSTEEFLKSHSSKKKAVTKSEIKGGIVDNSPKHTYMAKRFSCPGCGTTHWAEVLNFGEYERKARGIALKYAAIVFGALYLLVMVLRAVSGLISRMASLFN